MSRHAIVKRAKILRGQRMISDGHPWIETIEYDDAGRAITRTISGYGGAWVDKTLLIPISLEALRLAMALNQCDS